MALTDVKARTVKPTGKPQKLSDGGGMYLLVNPSGSKYWRFDYRYEGKRKTLAIGVYPDTSLADARKQRDSARELLASGVDPCQKKRVDKIELGVTFEHVAKQWHSYTANKTKKWGQDTARITLSRLENHIFPHIGNQIISKLTAPDLLAPLRNVEERDNLDMAGRLKQSVTAIMRYAVQNGIITHNPANDLSGALATRPAKHYPALPSNRIHELLNRIDNYQQGRELTKLALKLNLLVFVRSSELRFARWKEIDFDKSLWIIPAEREEIAGVKFSRRGSKMRTDHLVPLSKQSVQILRQIQEISGEHELIFIGDHHPEKPMSEGTINKALRNMGYDTKTDVCGHGFRGMASSALYESDLWAEDAIERQMSHMERKKVKGAYTENAKFIEQRNAMIQWWADYLDANREQSITPHDFAHNSNENVIHGTFGKRA